VQVNLYNLPPAPTTSTGTTQAHGTTQAAAGTTQAPAAGTTAAAPAGTTQAAEGTTQAAAGTTQAAAGTTQAPAGTTGPSMSTTGTTGTECSRLAPNTVYWQNPSQGACQALYPSGPYANAIGVRGYFTGAGATDTVNLVVYNGTDCSGAQLGHATLKNGECGYVVISQPAWIQLVQLSWPATIPPPPPPPSPPAAGAATSLAPVSVVALLFAGIAALFAL
jgi:hypothetical protein